MERFKPNKYYKDIYSINYDKLKKEGIKCLIFDLDNTLGLISHHKCPSETIKLINKLKKDFSIYICSNNTKDRLIPYMNELGIDGVWWSLKPSTRGPRIVRKKTGLSKSEIAIIGDQIVTDILAGKIYGITTILVDPMGTKDLKITAFNRVVENIIVKRYTKKGVFVKGRYYDEER